MAQRIVRAKKKIKATNLPYRVPDAAELPARLRSVLAVLYLIFTEGHRASTSDVLVREDLCTEAIRLSRLLCDLMPEEPEAVGLLALMLLTDARRGERDELVVEGEHLHPVGAVCGGRIGVDGGDGGLHLVRPGLVAAQAAPD